MGHMNHASQYNLLLSRQQNHVWFKRLKLEWEWKWGWACHIGKVGPWWTVSDGFESKINLLTYITEGWVEWHPYFHIAKTTLTSGYASWDEK